MGVHVDGAVARRVAWVELAEDSAHDRLPVDAIGERAADELDPERWMPAGTEPEGEVIETDEARGENLHSWNAPELRDDLRVARQRHVDVALPESCEDLGGLW